MAHKAIEHCRWCYGCAETFHIASYGFLEHLTIESNSHIFSVFNTYQSKWISFIVSKLHRFNSYLSYFPIHTNLSSNSIKKLLNNVLFRCKRNFIRSLFLAHLILNYDLMPYSWSYWNQMMPIDKFVRIVLAKDAPSRNLFLLNTNSNLIDLMY